jgi:hypothetical protein
MAIVSQTLPTTDNVGAISDCLTRNALAAAGTGALVGIGVGSVLITAAIIPGQVAAGVGVSAGLIYAGNRRADGKSLNPFAKKDETKTVPSTTETPVSEEVLVTAAA